MLKRIAIIFVGLGVVLLAQTRGTPSQLRVNVDANGYLLIAGASQTNPVTSAQFINARLNVDSNGNLGVICVSGCGSTGAPTDATYITQTANSTLTNEQALASLSTGLMFSTTTTGVVTTKAPTDDNLLVGSGTDWQLKALTSCSAASSAVTYNTTTNAFGCNTISASPAGSDTQVQFNNAGSFGGDSNLTWNNSTKTFSVLSPLAARFGDGVHPSGQTVSIVSLNDMQTNSDALLISVRDNGGAASSTYYGASTSVGTTHNLAAGTLDLLVGQTLNVTSTGTGVTTEAKIIEISGATISGGSSIGTLSGISIADILGASTNYAIHTGAGSVLFGDIVTATGYKDSSTPTSITSTSMNSCGTTSPTFNTGSSNSRGSFNVGATSGTDCTLTFSTAAAHFWACTASNDTTGNLTRGVETSTTVTKFQGVFGGADKVTYVCFPY